MERLEELNQAALNYGKNLKFADLGPTEAKSTFSLVIDGAFGHRPQTFLEQDFTNLISTKRSESNFNLALPQFNFSPQLKLKEILTNLPLDRPSVQFSTLIAVGGTLNTVFLNAMHNVPTTEAMLIDCLGKSLFIATTLVGLDYFCSRDDAKNNHRLPAISAAQ